jgi:hypothetical protein
MNRGEIKSRIKDKIDDHSTDGVFYTDTQLDELIDEAQELLVGETKSVHRSVLVPVRPGGQFIYLPAVAPDLMLPIRIWNNANDYRLQATSINNLSSFHQKWPTVVGSDPQFWFTVSWDIVGLFPRPVAGSGTLRIDYIAWPRTLLDDEDSPEIMEASHDAIVLFAAYLGELKKWNALSAGNFFTMLKQHGTLADGRSNVGKIVHRSFNRTGPQNRSDYSQR